MIWRGSADAPGLVPELQTAGLLNDMPLLDVELSEAEGYGLLHTMLREVWLDWYH
jgi:hypothetical protein